jgi:hypothetical protein
MFSARVRTSMDERDWLLVLTGILTVCPLALQSLVTRTTEYEAGIHERTCCYVDRLTLQNY